MNKKTNKMTFPRQYGYMSSVLRSIKNYEAKHGEQQFSINQLDEGCIELDLHKKEEIKKEYNTI